MKTLKALTLSLGELNTPIVSKYRLGLIIYRLYKHKEFRGEPLNLSKDEADLSNYHRYIRDLLDGGILDQPRSLPNSVYSILGRSYDDPDQAMCAIDPFCYISHLSAMAYHGLTNRLAVKLFISTPSTAEWKIFANERMVKDLGDDFQDYYQSTLPKLTRPDVKRIRRVDIHSFNSKHLGAYKNISGQGKRVSTIGRTFLDMLRNPELCGGINHVLEVFDEYAEQYLRLITDEVDQNGKAIDKVRAGFLIEERLKIQNDRVDSWASFAQRGGSRKLDPSGEYIPKWSEKWCISINTFEKDVA